MTSTRKQNSNRRPRGSNEVPVGTIGYEHRESERHNTLTEDTNIKFSISKATSMFGASLAAVVAATVWYINSQNTIINTLSTHKNSIDNINKQLEQFESLKQDVNTLKLNSQSSTEQMNRIQKNLEEVSDNTKQMKSQMDYLFGSLPNKEPNNAYTPKPQRR